MALVKVLKNRSYFKSFQTKFRRRREGKTDYRQRTGLIKQAKDKYNTPKYRLVVRKTNKEIICQVVCAKIQGDVIFESAYSRELKHHGVLVGLKNYASAYLTGYLCARRLLTKLNLHSTFKGKESADGEEYFVADTDGSGRNPFRCFLDVGLARTTVGAKVFAVLKGATDGGLDIPHNSKRFPGYQKGEGREGEYNPQLHTERISGAHVAKYMKMLQEEDEETYNKKFSEFIKEGINSDNLEEMYSNALLSIKNDCTPKRKETKHISHKREGDEMVTSSGVRYTRKLKLTLEQRKEKIQMKIKEALLAKEDEDME